MFQEDASDSKTLARQAQSMTVFSAARITSYDLPKPSWQGWQTPIHGLFLYGLQDKNGFYILKKNGFYIFKWWGGSKEKYLVTH